METKVYADGYGRWHADIPADRNDGTGLIIEARRAIRDELSIRSSDAGIRNLSTYVRENVCRARRQDRPGYIRFQEYSIDGD